MSFAIRVDNLGKRYQLGATHAGSVRELVNRGWNRLRGRTEAAAQPLTLDPEAADRVDAKSFWALRDVSFEVKPGEVVGIIGRNGSGKSTLLKILSQITAPTTGRVELHGRVASLLEVGTGFHPELSGRENVFLNGAILGMTKPEIRRKFDEIVAFAEIEKFIDTPVKRYSSGMYVRLAFAVAAHLEPEILMVDEVLAVGDAVFQQKCLGKMGDVAKGGRTVLFVSHNMTAVATLCEHGILLERGQLRVVGPSKEVLASYLAKIPHGTVDTPTKPLRSVSVDQVDKNLRLTVRFHWREPLAMTCLGFVIYDSLGHPICGTNSKSWRLENFGRGATSGTVTILIEQPKLLDGQYRLSLWLGDGDENFVSEKDWVTFEVVNMASFQHCPTFNGCVLPQCAWNFEHG